MQKHYLGPSPGLTRDFNSLCAGKIYTILFYIRILHTKSSVDYADLSNNEHGDRRPRRPLCPSNQHLQYYVGAYLNININILLFREEGDLSNSLQSKPAYAWNQLQHLRSVKNQLIWLLQKTRGGQRPDLEILVTIRAWSFVQIHIHLVTSSTFLSMQVPLIWTPLPNNRCEKEVTLSDPTV